MTAETPTPPAASSASLRVWLVRAIKLAIVVGALAWLVNSGRLDASDLRFQREGLPWLAASGVAIFIPFLLTFYRLHWVLRATGCALGLGEVMRIGFIGAFFNTFSLGSLGGDVVKVGYLVHASGKPAPVLASVLLDRAIALLAILSLGGLALLAASNQVGDSPALQGMVLVTLLVLGGTSWCGVVGVVAMARSRRAAVLLWVGMCVALGVVFLLLAGGGGWTLAELHPVAGSRWGRVASVLLVDAAAALAAALLLPACLPGGALAGFVRERLPLGGAFMRFVDALLLVRHRLWLMLGLWLLSMVSQGFSFLTLFLLARALPLEVLPTMGQIVAVGPLAMIANTVPVPGGGLGVGEAAFATLLELWTADGPVVTGGAAIFLAWRLWVVIWGLLGLPAFLLRGRPA
jgi:uncharacterized membrane protein YbhN (UPF0104 family)